VASSSPGGEGTTRDPIDHFKAVNDDDPGHLAAGDCVPRRAALTMQRALRSTAPKGTLFRRGGEEFVVLLADAGADAAMTCAEALRCAVRHAELPFEGRSLRVTISLGVAVRDPARPVDVPCTGLERCANDALKRAKTDGRDRVVSAGD
jgi:diguanylate cyclase (GGDEF)-like protein